MRFILDEQLFDAIDCSEGCLHITEFPATGIGDIMLPVWGVTLVKHLWPRSPFILADDQDTYLAGFSRFTFHGVVGVSLSVTLYDPAQGYRDFLRRQHEIVSVERTWGETCDWPFGYCDLTLWANGMAALDIDLAHRITAKQYCMAPQRFACPSTPKSADQGHRSGAIVQ